MNIFAFFLLGIALWIGRKVCSDVMNNIEKFGTEGKLKDKVATRTLFNFWLGFVSVIIVVSGIFELIGREVFLVLLIATLTTFGIKLSSEYMETRKLNE